MYKFEQIFGTSFLPHSPSGLSGYCFHPWCPDWWVGGPAAGKSLSGLYLRNRKV